MIIFLKSLWRDESGAVSVDWVALTAAMVGLALFGYSLVSSGVGTVSTKISSGVAAQDVGGQ